MLKFEKNYSISPWLHYAKSRGSLKRLLLSKPRYGSSIFSLIVYFYLHVVLDRSDLNSGCHGNIHVLIGKKKNLLLCDHKAHSFDILYVAMANSLLALQKLRVRLGSCKSGLSPPVILYY